MKKTLMKSKCTALHGVRDFFVRQVLDTVKIKNAAAGGWPEWPQPVISRPVFIDCFRSYRDLLCLTDKGNPPII